MTKENQIEQDLVDKLVELKYIHRPDIRDKATLEQNGILRARAVNGNYSLFEPQEMLPENNYFRKILRDFMAHYRFNLELFPAMEEAQQ